MKTAVYIIGWSKSCPIKIGMAQNVKKRLKGLQTGCPYKLRVYGVRWYTSRADAELAEALLHSEIREHRLEGEWFDVTLGQAFAAADSALGERVSHNGGKCVTLSKHKVPTVEGDGLSIVTIRKRELRAIRNL